MLIALLLAAVGLLVGAAHASASTISVAASPNPAKPGATITLTNTGTADTDALIYDYYERNGPNCAPTAANERARLKGQYVTTIEQHMGDFSDQAQFIPVGGPGNYRVCAYLYTGGADSNPPSALGTTVLTLPSAKRPKKGSCKRGTHRKGKRCVKNGRRGR